MMTVIEFYNMESTAIHIEMNVSGFEIWSNCLPDFHFWMHLFNFAPSSIADSLAVKLWRHEHEIQISVIAV